MASLFLVGSEISSQTTALADSQQAFYTYPIDVQVFWLQGKACVILPPDSYIASCSYVPLILLMHALTVLLLIVLGVYALIRKRVNLVPKRRQFRRREEDTG